MKQNFDVEWYIKNKADRIQYCCEVEAHSSKLDRERFHQLVIHQIRERAGTYDDAYGTSGFFKWLANVIYKTRENYDMLNHMVRAKELNKVIESGYVSPSEAMQLPIAVHAEPGDKPIRGDRLTLDEAIEIGNRADNAFVIGENPSDEKVCFNCKAKKPVGEFYANRNMLDGRDSSCKKCRREAIKKNKEAKKPQPMNGSKNPVITPVVASVMRVQDDISFNNDELIIMIDDYRTKQEALRVEINKLTDKLEVYESLIHKLERRKK